MPVVEKPAVSTPSTYVEARHPSPFCEAGWGPSPSFHVAHTRMDRCSLVADPFGIYILRIVLQLVLAIGVGLQVGIACFGILSEPRAGIVCFGTVSGLVVEVGTGGWEVIEVAVEAGGVVRWGIECMEEELRRLLSRRPLHRSMARMRSWAFGWLLGRRRSRKNCRWRAKLRKDFFDPLRR